MNGAVEADVSLNDKLGRVITDFSVSVNSKGYYEIVAKIDGERRRRFVRPNMSLYSYLKDRDIFNLSGSEKTSLAENLFPPE